MFVLVVDLLVFLRIHTHTHTHTQHSNASQTNSRLPQRDSGQVVSAGSAVKQGMDHLSSNCSSGLRSLGVPTVDIFATAHNTHLPQLMSPIPEENASVVDAVSRLCQGK